MKLRRFCARIFRIRNLAILIIFLVLIYTITSLRSLDSIKGSSPIKEFLQNENSLFNGAPEFIPENSAMVDWHNYEQIEKDSQLKGKVQKKGIGEQGKPARLSSQEEALESELYAVNGFNGALSDKISLNRSLPDIRHKKCQNKRYLASLPTVSVVVPFHNEHWSTLLRTVYSVLNRSPEHLIKEIFLVDDASTKEFLKRELDNYVEKNLKKVRVVRVKERSGLITARLAGAKLATADVLVFLDSHTEANVNWLPPLLGDITAEEAKVVCESKNDNCLLLLRKISSATLNSTTNDGRIVSANNKLQLMALAGSRVKSVANECRYNFRRTVGYLNVILQDPIARNYRTVVCPFIDVVAHDTFEYRAQDEGARGAFDWEFFYKRLPILPKDLENMPEPFESPVMAGGLFAISRRFFWELGGYDPGLDIWGGEQYELSFKVWQCGGRMLDAPCSRVGHIYRKFAPFPNPNHGDFIGKNYRRVADVWMDEYAEYLYQHRPHYRRIDPGDLTNQKELRKRLNCKSFRWFMTQVAFDLIAKYPPVEPEPFAKGTIRPESHPQLCVDARRGKQMEKLYLKSCMEDAQSEQQFVFSWHKDIRSKSRNMCWDLPDSTPLKPVVLYSCHLGGGNQLWRYRPDTKLLKHGDGAKCLDWDRETRDLYINWCDGSATQRWTVDSVDQTMMAQWDKVVDRVTGPSNDY